MVSNPPLTKMTGVAFSGGGIRSAAFCSGVLRRLLQRGVEPDYLSCVSGGGYTGTAYLDWKYRNNEKDDPSWHSEFFENMRSRTGILCDWQKPIQGVIDTLIITALILFVSVVTPVVMWGSHACPVAFCIDFFAGDILRADIRQCVGFQAANINSSCAIRTRANADKRAFLFAVPLVLYILFYFCTQLSSILCGLTQLVSSLCGLLFAFTFLPWFIHNFLHKLPGLMQLAVLAISILLWFFAPVLRRKASLVLIVYTFAYVVYWRVYKRDVLAVKYSDDKFLVLLFISALVMCFVPWIGGFQQHLFHVYNRWRLQKAFYTPESIGTCGCAGICWYDYFPGTNPCIPKEHQQQPLPHDHAGSLCLADLGSMKPQYISNIVVNEWRDDKEDKINYDLLTMSPTKIERIASQPEGKEFSEKLTPQDIKLSNAMATSAAAVSRHMGAYAESTKSIKHIQTILGLGMGATMVSDLDFERKQSCCLKVLPSLIEAVRVLPLAVLLFLYFCGGGGPWLVPIGVFVFLSFFVLLTAAAVVNTGDKDPGRLEKLARWLLVHVPFCRYMRELLGIINTGPVPPAILRLSDGGHIENLAILPLLKQRLQRIVVVNGGYTASDRCYGDALVHALELAREKLNCSFLSVNGRDVLHDIKHNFANIKEQQPRNYKFRVDYFDKENEYSEATKGEVILIAPRHPKCGVQTDSVTWAEVLRDINVDLEPGWGYGPYLKSEEVDRLTFCCCECCHDRSFGGISEFLFGVFPHHVTSNQFFTPAMFSAYHREGYRACLEASAAEFLEVV